MHARVVAEMMIVVKHHDQLLLYAFEYFVQEDVGGALGLLRQLLRLLQISEYRFAEVGDALLDAVSEIAQKNCRVVVGVIQLIPKVWPFLLAQKICDQSSFS